MNTRLALLLVASTSATGISVALVGVLAPRPIEPGPLVFWLVAALAASAAPIQLPRGAFVSVSGSVFLAAAFLHGPMMAVVVAALGTFELRELRGRVPWYGTLYNHLSVVIPALLAGILFSVIAGPRFEATIVSLVAAAIAGLVYLIGNVGMTAVSFVARGLPARAMLFGDIPLIAYGMIVSGPLAWLVANSYETIGWWAAALFALPLYSTRAAYKGLVDVRNMFTQTVKSLASAIDARDPFTNRHSENVKDIAVAIGREMRGKNRCSERELQQLEWGGLLHDVGKIGIKDAILLKPDRLTREERIEMNQHPVKGEAILSAVEGLHGERLIIRHHHEWYNGSGYPDHLVGEQIPKLARILHVADAFEAMTAARPYRKIPLTTEQAMAELRKYTGIQFDPEVVEAFARTSHARRARPVAPEPPAVPSLQQVAAARAQAQQVH